VSVGQPARASIATINFMVSPEGISVEEEIVRPAVQQAIEDYQPNKRNKKGGA
jgi:hypothetical protein